MRHYDLLPEQDWEVDIDGLEALADDRTVAMVVINPGNPCGNVYKREHLKKVVESIKNYLNIGVVPPTLTLGAITRILVETPEDFYSNTINLLRKAADTCYAGLREIPCFTPYKPQGSMFLMAKLNMSLMEGINNDLEFCTRLAREESVVVLPGEALGLKNWARVTFAVEISALEDGLGRIKAFCFRNAKQT
ncbi:nicotianamine aminotransferase 1-like isoform X3 [Lycium ferocissimum]|uniref:nicotianamine aminotransferase 1-like isoform X3 n=1 Tax=Lycium ferocissimum TaxID=112874 RepID=UPI002814C18D|nr:nicotianamine aminotransferase 1-like isoform X3 [Lycium ferocissimum]